MKLDRGELVLLTTAALGVGISSWVVWVSFTPEWKVMGVDFSVFYAAAHLASLGVDPYRSSANSVQDFANPPAIAFLLGPISGLPFRAAFALFSAVSTAIAGASIILYANRLGWRRSWLVAAAALSSWVGFQGLWWGQFDALLVAALLVAVLAARRGWYLAVGLVMGTAWVKPDLLWPAVLFFGIGLWPNRQATLRFAAGVVLTSIALLALDARFLSEWLRTLIGFGGGLTRQPDLAGFAAWVDALPASWHLGSGFSSPAVWAIMLLALAALGWLGRQVLTAPRWRSLSQERMVVWSVSLALGIWLLVTPYSHPSDELLLLPLLMLVVGTDASQAGQAWPAAALLTMATLPLTWNFPVLPVALTPVATAVLLIAGVRAFRRESAEPATLPPDLVLGSARLPSLVQHSPQPWP
ncbi:MAG: glycosyltransferase family 87 protein [Candidatus Dormibacteria bacterium]